MKPRVLLVDNDRERGGMLVGILAPGHECHLVGSLDEAFAVLGRSSWEAALTNYDLGPNQSGLELLQALRDLSPRTFRVLFCRYYCDGLARDAARLAAAHAVVNAREPDFSRKILETLARLLRGPSIESPPAGFEDPRGDELTWFAESAASKDFVRILKSAAESESPAFLHGEHGTGKNLAARQLLRWRSSWRERAGRDGQPAASSPPSVRVAIVAVPPLRERREDIPALARHCLERHARASGEPVRLLAVDALDDLLRREWWGNVRELHGLLIRACQRAGSRLELAVCDLPRDAEPHAQPSQSAKDEGQRECLLRQLRTAGNVSGAARLEGISRTNYIRLMRRLGIIRADTAPVGEREVAGTAPRAR
jgi:DNA-binding NtrC family response regulator